MKWLIYIISLPERLIRAGAALLGGIGRETAYILLPISLRQTRFYQATAERLLRITIELVGDVRGVYPNETMKVEELAVRKAAGNAVEFASFLAVGWSPLWLLAASSDLIGGTKTYLKTLQAELQAVGMLPAQTDVTSFDELLTALEGTSGVLADTIDVPPLNVSDIRTTWTRLQQQISNLPDAARLGAVFTGLQTAARQEGRSLLEMSGIIGLGAVRAGIQMGDTYLFSYYRDALRRIAQEGLVGYLDRVSRPYIARAGGHFDPQSLTYSERLVTWLTRRRPLG